MQLEIIFCLSLVSKLKTRLKRGLRLSLDVILPSRFNCNKYHKKVPKSKHLFIFYSVYYSLYYEQYST